MTTLLAYPDHLTLTFLSILILCVFFCTAIAFGIRAYCRPTYFYIVRHGETLLNKAHIKQGAEGFLSEKGKQQARELGHAFSDLQIEHIYSSPYERALQTATIMQETLSCSMTSSALLSERRNVSSTIGKSTEDPEVITIEGLTKYGYHEDSYRYADEENFTDLKTRAKACLSFLAKRKEHRIVIVTHHVFLHMLLSYMLYRDTLEANDLVKLEYFNPADNGGITLCVYHRWPFVFRETRGWEIVSYNQHV